MLFSLYEEEPSGGRPASLAEPPGQQERVPQRSVEPVLETFVPVPSLDVPVAQMVEQLVEVFRLVDTGVPEQVIDVPKITSQDVIPQRAVLRVPQMAEQLVTEATPCFEVFEEEVEEEEQQQPRVVPASYFMDAAGRAWCRVDGTSSGPLRRSTQPGQGGFQNWPPWGLRWLLRVLRASGPVPRQNGGHSSYATVTVAENCGGSAFAVPGCSTVDTYSASARETFGIISGFLREWADSALEID